MGPIRRALSAMLMFALVGAGATPAAAAGSPTWELRDIGQRMCVTSDFGHPGAYFLIPLYGDWSKTITTGMRNLPPGTRVVGSPTLPPGSHHEDYIIGGVHIAIAPAPVGVYRAEVWASDGEVTQAVPAVINVKERC
ncbi:DUF5980 family protein [Saccharothrix syringae]|uniref:Uncharacterized protein n=1 Tax=Saccharothrix syringae TaxID=103733 RepID=A0A5Q0H1B6_SACSY|nr:DUF5980 family protein [Saccharothrix syringae]QFZ19560.1 hypothetical protein EKG83_20865 [Saccharothrix syringae]